MGPAIGIERLVGETTLAGGLKNRRLALLSNARTRIGDGTATLDALVRTFGIAGSASGPGVARLFCPEHGWTGDLAAGTAAGDIIEPGTGLAVTSLYGRRHVPQPKTLADLDAIIVDLPDVGVRCFTYAATAAKLAEAALAAGCQVHICDRPNPLGPAAAGPRPDSDLRSFLAPFDVPFVHGLTIGGLLLTRPELAGADGLVHVACATALTAKRDRAKRDRFDPPSPALTHRDAVALYPGLVLLEGTNFSEGRGTDRPFRCVLAPALDGRVLAAAINARPHLGVTATDYEATPKSGKFAGQACRGVALDIAGNGPIAGLELGLHILTELRRDPRFAWLSAADGIAVPDPDDIGAVETRPASAYFIDRLTGTRHLRHEIDAGSTPGEILAHWS